ncbi:TonB-dependent receptor [uncultured Mucilaginibacter sp.]|uniref:TonB-dependent receptor domain-containing protein n=1 Tax=uncultured Mucilaginibacter sp. TaxID=797541 RepID=UPI0025D36B7C|nr:TonB-dependent receptor [uncultured Mucilaginibacter sp.]
MKIYLILFLLFALSFNLKAQNNNTNGKITGKVTDAVTKQPVDFATISVFKQGSASPFNGGSTDPKGNFKIDNVAPGDYMLTVDFIGYKQYKIAHVVVLSTNKNLAIGEILLTPLQTQLKEVSVTATGPTVANKIDKLVYSPANDLTSQGGVALDVLQKVPMVSVDINGNVELMGNANIQFLINGKPSTIFGASITDALQAIPASQIKSIEVITNPGAKYDAAGTGGIINIVLKDNNIQGVNGSVNLTAGTRLENGNFNINAKKGKIGVGAFFSGNENITSATPSSGNRTSYSNTRDTVTNLGQNGISNFKRSGYRSGFNINWDITPKDALSASVNFNHFGNNSNGYVNNYQTTYIGGLPADTNSVNHSTSKFNNNSTDWSLFYKKTFSKKDQELDVLYNQSIGHNTNNYTQQQDYTNVIFPSSGSIGSNPGTDKETNIQIDYNQPITEDFSIETGAKATIENINNAVNTQTLDNGVYVPNPFQTYSFTYSRKIYAYYLSATFSLFHNFIDGKAGLRDEYTVSTSDFPNTTIPSYNILAPSFVLSHKIDKTQTIKFSYSYRLERPDYNSLNPFYNISDPHNISTGNPELKPEYGHNFELGYNKSFSNGVNIYVAGFYRYNTNDLQSFTTFYTNLKIGDTTYTNVSLNQRYNIGREVTEGVNLFGSIPAGKFTFRSNMFFADRITSNPGSPQVSGLAYRINLNTSYEFAKTLAAEFFINYRSSQRGIQGTNPAFLFYNFAVRKQVLNKKASIGLTAANPFNRYVNVNSTTYGPNFNQSSLREIPLRSFGISLMYKFGKLEFKKDKEQQDNAAPDEGGGGGGGK